MKFTAMLPGRTTVGTLTLTLLIMATAADLVYSIPIDPYQAPAPAALGSGQAPSGAHCTMR
jgi:hypothetical protein